MAVSCAECGGATAWDDDAGSAICSTCGTLTDPTQSILCSHAGEPHNSASVSSGLWDPSPSGTLKSFRTGSNWDLTGQGKEAKDRKNNYAMAEFIKSLALSINASGLSPRTTALFSQAMSAGHFRWGRKAKLVAGACLSIALRESKRPNSLHDIAFLLDERPPALRRTIASVILLLKLVLTSADPAIHISSLQTHLSSALRDGQQQRELPVSLVTQLRPLCLRVATNTSSSLSSLLVRLGPNHQLNQLPTPPTACAIFILSLEAESRTPFKHLGELAQCLAARCHIGGGVVMTRYKLIQDIISTWIERLPWLNKYERKNGRAKVGKRSIVARGLKDVVQFQEEIWRKTPHPTVTLDLSDTESDNPSGSEAESTLHGPPSDRNNTHGHPPPRKRRKVGLQPVRDAAQFLLNPLTAPVSSISSTSISTSTKPPCGLPALSPTRELDSPPQQPQSLPLTSYILNTPPPFLVYNRVPTRLQLLSAARARGEGEISDGELFDEGELESLFRNEEEIKVLSATCGWDKWPDPEDEEDGEQRGQAKGKRVRKARTSITTQSASMDEGEASGESKRVDMKALAKFLEDEDEDEKEDGNDYDALFLGLEQLVDSPNNFGDDDGFFEAHSSYDNRYHDGTDSGVDTTPHIHRYRAPMDIGCSAQAEVVVNDWHPLSPEVSTSHDARSNYDEEYD